MGFVVKLPLSLSGFLLGCCQLEKKCNLAVITLVLMDYKDMVASVKREILFIIVRESDILLSSL